MKEKMIVGMDVSKTTLDFYCKPFNVFFQVLNNPSGFKCWWKEIKKMVSPATDILVVLEHTGRYSSQFESFLRMKGIGYCKLPAIEIKRSLGMVRGKNDKVDAARIAEYGWLRREVLTADQPCSLQVMQLKELLNLRTKMVRDRAGYINRIKELVASGDVLSGLERMHKKVIDVLTQQINELETRIRTTINNDESLKITYELIVSIKGIGIIVAATMICCTGNFTRFGNARKFNCYAGLAPFKHESGTSIRGRSRVSHMANKEIKSLLNLAACSAVRYDHELKEYYQRRVSEGKRKMSCLNIVRAKLVGRMFAVIKRQTPYQLNLAAA